MIVEITAAEWPSSIQTALVQKSSTSALIQHGAEVEANYHEGKCHFRS